MATATEVRAANGSSSKRGKLSAAAIADWNTNHPDDPYEPGAPRDGFTGNADDYPEDGFDSYFPEVDGDGDGLGDTSETPPKRPRANPKAGVKRGLFSRKPKTGAKKKAPPRVSTEDVWGALWRGGAKPPTPLPPWQRTLRMQAPVAGMIMDDVTKATVIDPLLQPIARLVDQGKAVQALAGPPVFVTAIMLHQQQRMAMDPPQEPNPLFMAIAVEGLRSSLMAWMDVAGPKFDLAMEREAEF